tara:strand:- start:208 stop:1059 length:852 start_codon:yes stop_codon:yes gene_type:complete
LSETNKDSKDFWSGKGGDIWVERQETMDEMLFPFGEEVLNKLELGQNLHVLDIGCGCGTTTLDIAKRIKRGKVTGIDISQPMLQKAKKSAKDKFLSNTSFLRLDVQSDDIGEGVYTTAFSRFGVMFFEDPVAAFTNINKSLVTNAQLSFVCWQSPSLNPWQSLFIQEVRKLINLPSPPPRSPGPFAFSESSYINSILEESNFVEVEIESFETDVKMFSGSSLSDAVKDYLSINPVVSEMLKDSPDDLKDQVVNAVIEVFTPYYSESGLIFPSASWIVNANKKV